MKFFDKSSLKWQLLLKITIAQTVVLTLIMCSSFVVFGLLWYLGYVNNGNSYLVATETISNAIRVKKNGAIYILDTPEMQRLRLEDPHFWYVVKTSDGILLTEGQPPKQLSAALTVQVLDAVAYADLGQDGNKSESALATIQWQSSEAGWVKVATGSRTRVTFYEILKSSQVTFFLLAYLVVSIIIATLIVIPHVIRQVFKKLDDVTNETQKIDINSSGIRLTTDSVPSEILPLVKAVNDTLHRLDQGYELHKRFLIDAAHELRTPISILTTRLSALPASSIKNRLLEDSARLTSLTGQLLDLKRLTQEQISFEQIDLVELAKHVVFDLAPLAFSAGYELVFEAEKDHVIVSADLMAIERALTNLIQNAINYGGRKGTISIFVSESKWIDVSDEGKGIPLNEVDRIFEPFYRLQQDGRGAGLGLDLVKKIMLLHAGSITLQSKEGQGACFRLSFPS